MVLSASLSPWVVSDPSVLDDEALLDGARELAELRRSVDAAQASYAAEIAHRSRPEMGFGGLAQRLGSRTPENLVQAVTGSSKREAATLTRVGVLLTPDAEPWLATVGSEVAAGRISIEKADVIRSGLGGPSADVAADDLADAAGALAELAPSVTVERLAVQARQLRDQLDATNVRDRHRALRDKRYLALTPLPDGMTRLAGLLDPESAALVTAAYDAATSPRRGGPRFVDPDDVATAERLAADDRTTGQLALDTFVGLLRVGSEADPARLLGAGRHAVQILVSERDLRQRVGAAFLREGGDAVPLETADRHLCDAGLLPVEFDDDARDVLRVGRTRRLFTARQRVALAARDGGCRFTDCDRPASWCEAHHRLPWHNGGPTDVDDGLLLCRHHHMLVHDNGWTIERDPVHGFVALPPRSVDPARRPRPMPARSPAAARLRAANPKPRET